MAEEKEAFLNRWSRLKKQEAEPVVKKDETPAPSLPPVDKLTPESDFTGFMHPKVEDALRRVALKKLFADPHFNVADPYEAYSGDWTGGEPIPPEVLATLEQMKAMLKTPEPQVPAEEKVEKVENKTEPDEPGRKDA